MVPEPVETASDCASDGVCLRPVVCTLYVAHSNQYKYPYILELHLQLRGRSGQLPTSIRACSQETPTPGHIWESQVSHSQLVP